MGFSLYRLISVSFEVKSAAFSDLEPSIFIDAFASSFHFYNTLTITMTIIKNSFLFFLTASFFFCWEIDRFLDNLLFLVHFTGVLSALCINLVMFCLLMNSHSSICASNYIYKLLEDTWHLRRWVPRYMSAAGFFLKNIMISFYLSLVKFVFNGAYSIFSRSKYGLKTLQNLLILYIDILAFSTSTWTKMLIEIQE